MRRKNIRKPPELDKDGNLKPKDWRNYIEKTFDDLRHDIVELDEEIQRLRKEISNG